MWLVLASVRSIKASMEHEFLNFKGLFFFFFFFWLMVWATAGAVFHLIPQAAISLTQGNVHRSCKPGAETKSREPDLKCLKARISNVPA